MMISTKGRYALHVMLDLSENHTGAYTPLKDIAERQGISLKYLESIMTVLSKAGFVDAVHGKGGGYKLSRAHHEYTVGSILETTEGKLLPVACPEVDHGTCERAANCRTLPVWMELERLIHNYLERITLADLGKQTGLDNKTIL
jgi:Rrf2 family protein